MMPHDHITKNFQWYEFYCPNGHGLVAVPEIYQANVIKVATELQKVRDILGKPIIVTSGFRTKEHNTEIGGAAQSQHLTGSAADTHCNGVPLYTYLSYLLRYTNFQGIGIGNPNKAGGNLIHTDIRKQFTVWVY